MRQIKLSLLVLTTILAANLPAYANDQPSTANPQIAQANPTDLIGVGVSIINILKTAKGWTFYLTLEDLLCKGLNHFG